MPNPFRYYLRIRYGECDAQKVVFNARYADYIDLATSEYLRALGFGEVLDYQLVKLLIEWKGPARHDQVLELSVATKHLGTTSFTLSTEIRIAGDERIIATAETVNVFVEPHTLRKTPLPADLRSALEKGAPGAVTNHAAYL